MANHERARSFGGDTASLPNNSLPCMPPRLRRPSSSTYPTLQLPADFKSLSEPGTRQPSQSQMWIPCSASPSSSEQSPSPHPHHQSHVTGNFNSNINNRNSINNHHHHYHHQHTASASSMQSTPPTLYSPATTALSSPGSRPQLFHPSPYLHHTQRQPIKETHLLDKDFDPISGRKSINHYEIINEIGRGVHGKVKLGRNLENGEFVAIKIIDRTSRPRLGRQGLNKVSSQEEKVRREIAILKKCKHENVVQLLEVIDDPASKKVYLVLEYVELGEIKWRLQGDERIVLREARRVERLRRLATGEPLDQLDDDPEADRRRCRRRRRRRQREKLRKAEEKRAKAERGEDREDAAEHLWSLELGGQTESDDDDDDDVSDFTTDASDDDDVAVQSNSSYRSSHLEELLATSLHRNLSFSTTTTSSELDPELMYVPSLTLQQARALFRDTVLGLEYLHFQGIIHRDIKPANLLWNREHQVKISDFGVSYLGPGADDENAPELDQADIELAKTVGTPAFFAPELCYTGEIYYNFVSDTCADPVIDFTKPRPPITAAIDIWALGVTLYCLVFARCPFLAEGEYELFNRICDQPLFIPETRLRPNTTTPAGSRPSTSRKVETTTYESISSELRDLLDKLLTKDQRHRITLEEVKRHPWVLTDLEDPMGWIEDSDPQRIGLVEVSKEEVEAAVIPASILGRVRSGIRKVVGGVAGVVGLRRRAHSAVAVASANTGGHHDILDTNTLHPPAADRHEVPESEAEKALRKKSSSLAAGVPFPSPLRRSTSVANGKDRASSTPPALATGPFAPPPPLPPTPLSQSTPPLPPHSPEPLDRLQHQQQQSVQQALEAAASCKTGIFSNSRFGIGKIVRGVRSRDLIGETSVTKHDGNGETSTRHVRPVTSGDIVHRPAAAAAASSAEATDSKKKGKDKEKEREKSGSLRSLGSVFRRSSRQSFDSLMRLSANTSNNSGSPQPSLPSSPMPSMPVSPIEGPHRILFPNEEPAAPTPVPAPAPTPVTTTAAETTVVDAHSKRRFIRSVSPTGSRRRNSFCPPVEEEDSQRILDEDLFMVKARSGDDSTVSSQVSRRTWGPRPTSRTGARSQGNASPVSMISPDISPRARSPAATPHTPARAHHHRHTQSDKVPSERSISGLVTSSSDERFATSSLTNSTSYPSILSASSSLSTDEQWSTYNAAASPKRLEDSPSLLASPRVMPLEACRPTLPTMRPELFVGGDMTKVSPISSVHQDDYEPDDDDCESDDDDDDNDGGFVLNLNPRALKSIRSQSLSVAELQRSR